MDDGDHQTWKKFLTLLGAGTESQDPSASARPLMIGIINLELNTNLKTPHEFLKWSLPPQNTGHSPFGLSLAEHWLGEILILCNLTHIYTFENGNKLGTAQLRLVHLSTIIPTISSFTIHFMKQHSFLKTPT